jgi:hypothetical protein
MMPLRSLAANGGARRYPVGFNHLPHRARSTDAVTEVMKTAAQSRRPSSPRAARSASCYQTKTHVRVAVASGFWLVQPGAAGAT